MEYRRCPAAFINAIAEEGTKAEAIEWLQRTWNELMLARSTLRAADDGLRAVAGAGLLNYMGGKSDEGRYLAEITK